MISAPTNFNHISHLGPGDGIQNQYLLDLPTTVETADQNRVQRTATLSAPRIPIRQPFHPFNGEKYTFSILVDPFYENVKQVKNLTIHHPCPGHQVH